MKFRQNLGKIVWGIVFIVMGFGLAGAYLNVWNFDLFFDGWWTLFIIVPCFVNIIQVGFRWGNSIGLFVGVVLLLEQQDIFPNINLFKLTIPILLVAIGCKLIFGFSLAGRFKGYTAGAKGGMDSRENPDYLAIFSGCEAKNNSQSLQSGDAVAVFGGIELDLRDAVVTQNICFDVVSVFGGVDILSPRNVHVVVTGVPIFGGYSNDAVQPVGEFPTVTFNCVAIFGGVDIK